MDSATYIPTISTVAEVHFYNQTKGIDKTVSYDISLALDSDMDSLDWSEYIENQTDFTRYPKQPPKDATFEELPSFILEDKRLKSSQKSCIDYLYHNSKLTLYKCKSLKVESKPDEEKADFLVRVQDVANDKKEEELEKLKARYKKRLDTLEDRLQRAQERVEKEKSDSTSSMLEAGISILGALFGRTTPTKLGRAVSKSSKILKERGDLSRAEQRVAEIQSDIEDLEYELEDKIDELNQKYDIDNLEISEYFIKPKKTNIEIKECAVVWRVAI
jgi:DNA-binding ferritin-like protein